ncbi:hypothetical protein RJT34_00660 [Clitoria ternatea]|uniref:Uncharacterized protein n=1 Tax=Clitoria ternatea TaxID=43366 RepID=A0AAN9PY57_CLITE
MQSSTMLLSLKGEEGLFQVMSEKHEEEAAGRNVSKNVKKFLTTGEGVEYVNCRLCSLVCICEEGLSADMNEGDKATIIANYSPY